MLPITLRDLLANRLDRLGPAKSVAQLGAVIGRDFSIDQLRMIADQSPDISTSHLARLQRSGLAGPSEEGRAGWFTFKHALVRDAAYESIPRSRRVELHGRLATALLDSLLDAAGADRPPSDGCRGRRRRRHVVGQGRRSCPRSIRARGVGRPLHRRSRPRPAASRRPRPRPRGAAAAVVRGAGVGRCARVGVARGGRVVGPGGPVGRRVAAAGAMLPVIHGLWVHHMSAGKHEVALGWARRATRPRRRARRRDPRAQRPSRVDDLPLLVWRSPRITRARRSDSRAVRPDAARRDRRGDQRRPYTADGSYRCQSLWMLGHRRSGAGGQRREGRVRPPPQPPVRSLLRAHDRRAHVRLSRRTGRAARTHRRGDPHRTSAPGAVDVGDDGADHHRDRLAACRPRRREHRPDRAARWRP